MKRFLSMLLAIIMIVTIVPVQSFAANGSSGLMITVESINASPGSTIDVDVTISNNTGILGTTLKLSYDNRLTLLNAVSGDAFSYLTMTKPGNFASPCKFIWDGIDYTDSDLKDGVILTLTFEVSENVSNGDSLGVAVNVSSGDTVDADLNPVNVSTTNGAVNIVDYTPGDVNNDGLINTSDIILVRRHIVGGYNTSINECAANVSGDVDENGAHIINTVDIITLRRYVAEGYDIELLSCPCTDTPVDSHTLEAVSYLAPTCTTAGHIAYWHCTDCNKYFSDANGRNEIALDSTVLPATGHTEVADTDTPDGYTPGTHCSVCGIVMQESHPIEVKTRRITYDIANGDSYLQSLQINNPNPTELGYTESKTLQNPSVAGYRFLGWYDLPSGSNAEIVKRIDAGEDDLYLYAHWEKISYTIQFKSSLYPIDSINYTVDKGAVLPTPKLSNYIFAGWSGEDGKLFKKTAIPIGTTGNITLTANWTSERNKAVTKTKLDAPIIYEDEANNLICFAYEIGKIENVPLDVIKDFGYISGDGVTKTATETYTVSMSEETAQAYARAVSNATTRSTSWTLSSGWTDSTSVNSQWCKENNITEEEAIRRGTSDTSTWNISSGSSGSTDTTHLDTNQDNWQNEVKINASSERTDESKIAAGVESKIGVEEFGIKAEMGASLNVEDTTSVTKKSGLEVGGNTGNTSISTDSTVTNSSWNQSSSYGGSKTVSEDRTLSRGLSETISVSTGYGKDYIQTEDWENSEGMESTNTQSDEYTLTTVYNKITSEERTNTWTTQATKPGYHRWIIAGTAHVFAVVTYDMSSQSYFVNTFSIMDDETHEFEDYSYVSASYDDNQNGCITFEVPEYVAEYVANRTSGSEGLKVNQQTGEITGYSGTDNCVVIPEYMNVGDGDVVKITGINKSAFKGNTNIKAVVLSDYIETIPDNAFEGCTSLLGVLGGNIKKIGNSAFSGCTSIVESGITPKVTSLGTNAFNGAEKLMVNPANSSVVEAAVKSGAKNIILYLNSLDGDSSSLKNVTLTVPEGTEYFEINGYGKSFDGLTLISDAEKTVINKVNFTGSGAIPLKISSSEVVLNQVTAKSAGLALVLTNENTRLGLQGTVTIQSDNENAILCKNVTLYESNSSVDGKLAVTGKIVVCGDIYEKSYLASADIRYVDVQTFENMLNSYTLYFDAAGGDCSVTSKVVANTTAVGELPVPTRAFYTFEGWYLADGTKVTSSTVFSSGADQTVYAHWTKNTYQLYFNPNGGSVDETERTVVLDEKLGSLPVPTKDYYNFTGWYTSETGGERITEESSFSQITSTTIYAHWEQKSVSDWVTTDQVPADAQIVNRKWRYTLTSYTESTATSLSGYTCYDSYWVQSGSGSFNYSREFPSGFDTGNWYYTNWNRDAASAYENTTNKRTVSNSWAGYIYWHWMYDTNYANGVSNRAIYDRYGVGPTNNFLYKYFGAFNSSTNYTGGDTGYCNNLNIRNYIVPDRTSWDSCQGATRWFRFNYYLSSYTDYYKMFKYKKVENNLESSTNVSGQANVSNVTELVQHREK